MMKTAKFTHNGIEYEVDIPGTGPWMQRARLALPPDGDAVWIGWDHDKECISFVEPASIPVLRARHGDRADAPAPAQAATPVSRSMEDTTEPPWVEDRKIRSAVDLFVSGGPTRDRDHWIDRMETYLEKSGFDYLSARRMATAAYLANRYVPKESAPSVGNTTADPICLCPASSEYDPPCPRHGVVGIGVTPREPPSVEQTEIESLRHRLEIAHEEIGSLQREMGRANNRHDDDRDEVRLLKDSLREVRAERDRLRADTPRILSELAVCMSSLPSELRNGPSVVADVRGLAAAYNSLLTERDKIKSVITQMTERHDEDQNALRKATKLAASMTEAHGHARDARDELRKDIERLRQEKLDLIAERDALHAETMRLGHQVEMARANERELQRLRAERDAIQCAAHLSNAPTLRGFTKEIALHEQVMAIVFDGNRAMDLVKSREDTISFQTRANNETIRERDEARATLESQTAANRLSCEQRDKALADLAEHRMGLAAERNKHTETIYRLDDALKSLDVEREQVGLLKHALEEAQKELRTLKGGYDSACETKERLLSEMQALREELKTVRRTGSEPNRTTEPGGLTALLVRTEEQRDRYRSALEEALTDLRVLTGHEPKTTQPRSELLAIIDGMREQLRAKDNEIRQYQRARGWEPDEVTPEILRGAFTMMEGKIRELSASLNRFQINEPRILEERAAMEEKLQVQKDLYRVASEERANYRSVLEVISKLGRVCPGYMTCEHDSCGDSNHAATLARTTLRRRTSPVEAQSGS